MRPHLCLKCLSESITVMVKCGLLSLTPTPLLPDLYSLLQVPPAPLHAYPHPGGLPHSSLPPSLAFPVSSTRESPSCQHQSVPLTPAPESPPHATEDTAISPWSHFPGSWDQTLVTSSLSRQPRSALRSHPFLPLFSGAYLCYDISTLENILWSHITWNRWAFTA